MKKFILLIFAIVLSAGAFWLFGRPAAPAPEVTFSTVTGKQITTSELRGKVVLVKFWATSCVTCVAQMPNNIENYEQYKDKGFDIVAVAMQYDPANYVLNFIETRHIPFTVALDSRGIIAKSFGDIKLTPTAFLINRKGQIIKRYVGDYDKAEFRATLEKALAS